MSYFAYVSEDLRNEYSYESVEDVFDPRLGYCEEMVGHVCLSPLSERAEISDNRLFFYCEEDEPQVFEPYLEHDSEFKPLIHELVEDWKRFPGMETATDWDSMLSDFDKGYLIAHLPSTCISQIHAGEAHVTVMIPRFVSECLNRNISFWILYKMFTQDWGLRPVVAMAFTYSWQGFNDHVEFDDWGDQSPFNYSMISRSFDHMYKYLMGDFISKSRTLDCGYSFWYGNRLAERVQNMASKMILPEIIKLYPYSANFNTMLYGRAYMLPGKKSSRTESIEVLKLFARSYNNAVGDFLKLYNHNRDDLNRLV